MGLWPDDHDGVDLVGNEPEAVDDVVGVRPVEGAPDLEGDVLAERGVGRLGRGQGPGRRRGEHDVGRRARPTPPGRPGRRRPGRSGGGPARSGAGCGRHRRRPSDAALAWRRIQTCFTIEVPDPAAPGADQPRAFSASISFGTTLWTSPTTPRSATEKIGASRSLLMATMFFEPFIPTRCWVAPEMPQAM